MTHKGNWRNLAHVALGRVYVTPGADARFDYDSLVRCLMRHASGDWGDIPPEDAAANDADLRDGGRLVSAYNLPEGRVRIVTEVDHSATVILLPEEY